MRYLHLIIGNLLVTVALLASIELVSFLFLKTSDSQKPFLLNRNIALSQAYEDFNGEMRGTQQVDALTGWSETDDELRKKGYEVENGFIALRTATGTGRRLNILITGGSTSDVSFSSSNWPAHLISLLDSHCISATIYAGSVVGYHSGQELLKLIRDGLDIHPDIHISYSGANEGFHPGYVTAYEQHFFHITSYPVPALMPNTIFLLRKIFRLNQFEVKPVPRKTSNPEQFWQRNMQLMHGVAEEYGYQFAGVLQPVVGSGNYNQPVSQEYSSIVELYGKFYPQAKSFAGQSDYMEDLSSVFDTVKDKVYLDHCHVDSAYQQLIARSIYDLLEKRNLLTAAIEIKPSTK